MDPKVRITLAELNRVFYARFAGDFARTRRGWPLGFKRILPHLLPAANVLDLGCGNGRLWAFLVGAGWRGHYLGVDSSPELLAIARQKAREEANQILFAHSAEFLCADLLDRRWPSALGAFRPHAIAALALLHHIPAAADRGSFLAECGALLPQAGMLVISTWQFLAAARLRSRILPWSAVGLRDEDVEPGDYLLSWGQGAIGRRYCAAIDEAALRALGAQAGLTCIEAFQDDGREGYLNLYGVFQRRLTTAT